MDGDGKRAEMETMVQVLRSANAKHPDCAKVKLNGTTDLLLCEAILLLAAELGEEAILSTVLDHGVNCNFQYLPSNDSSCSVAPLLEAIRRENINIIKTLLERGANADEPFIQYEHPISALTLAAEIGNKEIVELLLDFGASIDQPSYYTALCAASMQNHYEIAELLLNRGAKADINLATYYAVCDNYQKIVVLLLDHGADPNYFYEEMDLNDTCLIKALANGNLEIARILLERGANVNAKDINGQTALHAALWRGQNEAAKWAIKNGANVMDQDEHQWTSLHFAACDSGIDKNVIELIIKKGIPINVANEDGQTPLHLAMIGNVANKVKLFLQLGADINLVNDINCTPLRMAQTDISQGLKLDCAKLFVEHIAIMESEKLFIHEANLNVINSSNTLKTFFIECKEELESMKDDIGYFIITKLKLYDILKMQKKDKYFALARNKVIRRFVFSKFFLSIFPMYGDLIWETFSRGVEVNEHFEVAKAFFHSLAIRQEDELPKLNLPCIESIVSYLSSEDLVNLSTMFN